MQKLSQNRTLLSFVVAMTSSGGIGYKNDLPWKIKKDMKHFEFITTNIQSKNRFVEEAYKSSPLTEMFKSKIFDTKNNTSKTNTDTKIPINACIMGRKTYDSIPEKYKPLKNRINIILSSNILNKSQPEKNIYYFTTIKETLDFINSYNNTSKDYLLNEVFVIGGSYIFNEFMNNEELKNLIKSIYLTTIYKEIECDVFWKTPTDFEEVSVSKTEVEKDYVFDFRILVNKNLIGEKPIEELVSYDALKQHPQHEEFQYLNHIKDIIDNGKEKRDRTGVGTISKFGLTMRFDCSNTFPLLTTKDTYWKGIVEELLWFIKGCTSNKVLKEKKVRIWDGNSTREYLDSIGLTDREEGDLGPIYGFQWRHSGAEYITMHEDYTGKGVDQLAEVIDTIKNNPNSRRIIICAWNPNDLKKMALPPCHVLCQFYVNDGVVSLQMYQRSCDMGLGVPFNIASYALLLKMICHVTGTTAGEYIHILGDAHVYKNHVEPLKIQLERNPLAFPVLKINEDVKNIDDFTFKDFTLVGYKHLQKIKMEMAV